MPITFHASRLPDPREVKKLADRLIEAENELAKVKSEWTALFTSAPVDEDSGKGTLSDRILDLISSRFQETFTAPQVTTLLGANPNSVGPLLSRLVAEKKIRKVGHGEYRGHTPRLPWMPEVEGLPVEDVDLQQESPAALVS